MALTPHPRVTIDGSSLGSPLFTQYESEVNGDFDTMRLNRVGQALIGALTRALRIQPYTGTDLNATSTPTNRGAAEVAGRRSYRCDNALPRTDPAGNPILGTGGGSDSIVAFNPSQWLTSGIADNRRITLPVGSRRDEILFHEMVHSIRQMAGTMNCSTGAAGFDTKEEVWSIMATNIYSSAWNRPLRRDHHGFVVMTADEVRTYYTRFEVMIGHFCRELPGFTRAVSLIAFIPFNPFRDYYRLHP